MSVRQMALVWELDLPTTKKMLLLAIADHADDDGDNAWPSTARLSMKVGIDARSVRRLIKDLAADGYLTVGVNQGGTRSTPSDRRPNLYRLHLTGRTPRSEREDTQVPPREDPQVHLTIPITSKNNRDEIFDALVKVCGIWSDRLTPSARGGLNRSVKELRSVGATAEGVETTAKVFTKRWPDALITPTAVSKWYGTFSVVQATRGPSRAVSGQTCEACDGTGWAKPDPGDLGPQTLTRCDDCGGAGLVPTKPAA
jgi:hypothetical protein